MSSRAMVSLIKADGFYSPETVNGLREAVYSVSMIQTPLGKQTQGFNFIQEGIEPTLSRVVGEKVILNRDTGEFKILNNTIHFDGFDSLGEWCFVVALEPTTFNLYFHKSGSRSALEGYEFNYKNFINWDYHTNVLLEPNQCLFYRPWVFHSFNGGLIQHFQLTSIQRNVDKKIVLVMGLPGAGKTTMAKQLSNALNATHLNAEVIREMYNDWDFSYEGRERQAYRMRRLADESVSEITIVDFVCPLHRTRDFLKPDYILWMDTIKLSRFEDTNTMFEAPVSCGIRITNFGYSIKEVSDGIMSALSI